MASAAELRRGGGSGAGESRICLASVPIVLVLVVVLRPRPFFRVVRAKLSPLEDRARELEFKNVVIIDEDLGVSGWKSGRRGPEATGSGAGSGFRHAYLRAVPDRTHLLSYIVSLWNQSGLG
jgi:hypothetical protein